MMARPGKVPIPFLGRQLGDHHSAVGAENHEALHLELAKGFTNRHPAYAELSCDPILVDLLARPKDTVQHELAEVSLDQLLDALVVV